MKRIVCFGDSNTYGCDTSPAAKGLPLGRFDENTRWTGVLQNNLGPEYRVIEEGLNGRTTVFEDDANPGRNGLTALDIVFLTNDPVDLYVIMLGTNDIRSQFSDGSAFIVMQGMQRFLMRLESLIKHSMNPDTKVLVISPLPIRYSPETPMCYKPEWIEEAKKLPFLYQMVCGMFGYAFADASQWAEPGFDGIHLDPDGHRAFAEHVEDLVHGLIG